VEYQNVPFGGGILKEIQELIGKVKQNNKSSNLGLKSRVFSCIVLPTRNFIQTMCDLEPQNTGFKL
jgi:hypothetical protein